MKCSKGYEIQILLAGENGYYIGTLNEVYEFNCKISDNYFPSKVNAKKELDKLENIDKVCKKCYNKKYLNQKEGETY